MSCFTNDGFKLLNDLENLYKEGKLTFNQKYYEDLLEFRGPVVCSINWNNRQLLVVIIQKYLNNEINGEEFFNEFQLFRAIILTENDLFFKKLSIRSLKIFFNELHPLFFQNMELQPQQLDFSHFIYNFNIICQNFNPNFEEEEFSIFIRDAYSDLKILLDDNL